MRLDRVDLPKLDALAPFGTPGGLIVGRVLERYAGLAGQARVALVDVVGRVHHYDLDDLECPMCGWTMGTNGGSCGECALGRPGL